MSITSEIPPMSSFWEGDTTLLRRWLTLIQRRNNVVCPIGSFREVDVAHWQSAWLPRQLSMRPGFEPRWSCVGFSEQYPCSSFLNVTRRSRSCSDVNFAQGCALLYQCAHSIVRTVPLSKHKTFYNFEPTSNTLGRRWMNIIQSVFFLLGVHNDVAYI